MDGMDGWPPLPNKCGRKRRIVSSKAALLCVNVSQKGKKTKKKKQDARQERQKKRTKDDKGAHKKAFSFLLSGSKRV